jgi:predicted nucleic acid-binding protein
MLNMPEAISDSSTLIHLAGIERLEVLKEFYQEIFIPFAVWKEVVEEGLSRQGAAEVKEAINAGWIKIRAPTNNSVVRLLERELHKGEAEAIALAIEHDANVIFLDELEARRVAKVYGLHITGTIGILIRTRLEGKIASLREELNNLRDDAGFWIGDEIYRRALQAVAEE